MARPCSPGAPDGLLSPGHCAPLLCVGPSPHVLQGLDQGVCRSRTAPLLGGARAATLQGTAATRCDACDAWARNAAATGSPPLR